MEETTIEILVAEVEAVAMDIILTDGRRGIRCLVKYTGQARSAETSSGVVRGVRTLRAIKPSRPACRQPSADCRSISASWRMLSISTLSRGAGSPLHDTTLTTPGRSSTVNRFVPRSR